MEDDMATNIDTLATYETIAAAGIADAGARAISKAIADSASHARADLATKPDLELLGSRLEKIITDTQNKTLIWMFGMLLGFTGVIGMIVKYL